jgi:hypothetical protein
VILLVLLGACSQAASAPPVPLPGRIEAGSFVFDQVPWVTTGAAGVAFRVRVPRSAEVDVVDAGAVAGIEAFVGDAPLPWAAVNGGFYEDGAPMGLVVSEGRLRHPLASRGGSGVLLGAPGPAQVVPRAAWTPGGRSALQSVDRLVDGGASLVAPTTGAHRDARSAVAISADAVWLVVTAAQASLAPAPDGLRLVDTVGQGMTLAELADWLVVELGAQQALNLDGAVSSQMVVATAATRWVLHGERGTINAVRVRLESDPVRPSQ